MKPIPAKRNLLDNAFVDHGAIALCRLYRILSSAGQLLNYRKRGPADTAHDPGPRTRVPEVPDHVNLLVVGYWMGVVGCWMGVVGCWMWNAGWQIP